MTVQCHIKKQQQAGAALSGPGPALSASGPRPPASEPVVGASGPVLACSKKDAKTHELENEPRSMICDVTDTRGENNTNTRTRRVTQRLSKTQDWYRGGFERESNRHFQSTPKNHRKHDAQLVGRVACVPSTICATNHEKITQVPLLLCVYDVVSV